MMGLGDKTGTMATILLLNVSVCVTQVGQRIQLALLDVGAAA